MNNVYSPTGGQINYAPTSQTPNWNQSSYIQTMQQPQRVQIIPGKVVNSHDEIGPQDVPMNGMVSIFPKSDYSEIYAKFWTNNGTIETRVYTLNQADTSTDLPMDLSAEILSRLSAIEKKLEYKPRYNNNKYKPRNKPEEVKNDGQYISESCGDGAPEKPKYQK